jgi:hypothetical protein
MTSDGLAQSYGSGLCGMVAILNALRVLTANQRPTEHEAGELQFRMACALNFDGHGAALAAALFRDGTDRSQVKGMLQAACLWSREVGISPPLAWDARHPHGHNTAKGFWKSLEGFQRPTHALLVGFGNGPGRYEPHWTVVESIWPAELDLRDSAGYGRVKIHETGIRPEPGWAIQDCFILTRR